MTDATKSPHHETHRSHTIKAAKPASSRKAESNRRNAQKSTGPRTANGKVNSSLNALKHGILASQSVITTMEGREHRGEFEALVDGLTADFQPVGTFEQLLVQDIAACFWRKRRLLRFESRSAFEARDRRTFMLMQRFRGHEPQPAYSFDGRKADGDEVLDAAHLGLDIPSDADCMRVVRYEGTISRTLRAALAQLKTRQTERVKNRAGNSSAYADREVVVDADAMKLNAGPGHRRMDVKSSLLSRALDREKYREEEEEHAAELEAEEDAALAKAARENVAALFPKIHQTKPNSSADTGVQAGNREHADTPASSSKDDAGAHEGPPIASK
jgi:hypothetical protein